MRSLFKRIFKRDHLLPTDSIYTEKIRIREDVNLQKKRLTEEQKLNESAQVFDKIENTPEFLNSNTILMYWSLPDELPTKNFIEKWYEKKTILLPVVTEGNLKIRQYTGLGSLKKGSYGISEPTENLDFQEIIDLAIVPGVAFDKQGRRIGRGKGYYDRFLKNKSMLKWGVCFDFQIYDKLPSATFDIMMDRVFSTTYTNS